MKPFQNGLGQILDKGFVRPLCIALGGFAGIKIMVAAYPSLMKVVEFLMNRK
jgi:hypothetical protein